MQFLDKIQTRFATYNIIISSRTHHFTPEIHSNNNLYLRVRRFAYFVSTSSFTCGGLHRMLRLRAMYKAKNSKNCKFWTFWPVIQLTNHLFKIRQKDGITELSIKISNSAVLASCMARILNFINLMLLLYTSVVYMYK